MAKKKIKIIRTINTGIFDALILLSVNFNYDELTKKIGKEWTEPIANDKELINSGSWLALSRIMEETKTGKKFHYFYIIIPEMFDFSDKHMVSLAHEVLHICQFFMKDILDMEREYECVAYTHTHIMKQCLKELREAYK